MDGLRRRDALPVVCSLHFICVAPGDEFVLELADETLHRPRTGFAERANRPAARNVVGDFHEIIGVSLAALTMRQAVKGFGHPERAFAAGRALTAAFVG